MFSKKKKTSALASKSDLSELDATVGELTKQTSELLSHFGEAENKDQDSVDSNQETKSDKTPQPKKSGGKSFDIIHDPKRKTSLKSTLKASEKSSSKSETTEMLPEHATKSYNEVSKDSPKEGANKLSRSTDSAKISSDESKSVSSEDGAVPEVIGHAAGSLRIKPLGSSASDELPVILEEDVKDEEIEKPENKDVEENTEADTEESKASSKNSISFEENKLTQESDESQSEQTDEAEVDEPKEETTPEAVSAEETEDQPEPKDELTPKSSKETSGDAEEPSVKNSGEVYANNLVHDSSPKSYSPAKNQQKPTVFDTNEYHVELHDWSKLEHKASVTWYVLALLVVIAAALVYFIFSEQVIPFVGLSL